MKTATILAATILLSLALWLLAAAARTHQAVAVVSPGPVVDPVTAGPSPRVLQARPVRPVPNPIGHRHATSRTALAETVRRCIVWRESRGIPTARRSDGETASGLYGFIDATWARYGGFAHAWQAPAVVQTARFWQVWNDGRGRSNWYWAGHTQCWGTP